ncbi:MAG TPA: tetratricopeptide repeat protein [Candidatus Sulfotelmatobacter sp.]|nr:tetratricopeptide repeat protein [Candidatus Sulfotelmatobacter sp.]
MGVRRVGIPFIVAVFACGLASAANCSHSLLAQSQETSTSTQHRSGANSSSTVRHTRIVEEDSGSPDLTKAEDLIQKHDYAAAETLLQKLVAADPSSYVAWFDLGFTENGLGKMQESIAAYRKSVAAKADVFESNLNLGIQLAKAGQPDADQFLRAATQLKPTSHPEEGQERAWLSLAHVLEGSNPDEAIAAYRRAGTLQPKDPEPHLNAGALLEKQSKFADAESEYKQALALNPASQDALTGLANLYMRGRHFPEAEGALRKLAVIRPGDADVRIQLGRALAAEDKNDDAVAELEKGAKLAPNDLSVQRDLAELYSTTGKYDQAEATYHGLIAAHPNDAELHHDLGKSLLRQKKFPAAQQEFLIAIKIKPNFGDAYGDLAFAASENKDYPLTLKALDARVKLLPENAVTYFLRASALDHLRDVKHAVENYHLFLKAANGKYPDYEWQAQHRLIALEPKK